MWKSTFSSIDLLCQGVIKMLACCLKLSTLSRTRDFEGIHNKIINKL